MCLLSVGCLYPLSVQFLCVVCPCFVPDSMYYMDELRVMHFNYLLISQNVKHPCLSSEGKAVRLSF